MRRAGTTCGRSDCNLAADDEQIRVAWTRHGREVGHLAGIVDRDRQRDCVPDCPQAVWSKLILGNEPGVCCDVVDVDLRDWGCRDRGWIWTGGVAANRDIGQRQGDTQHVAASRAIASAGNKREVVRVQDNWEPGHARRACSARQHLIIVGETIRVGQRRRAVDELLIPILIGPNLTLKRGRHPRVFAGACVDVGRRGQVGVDGDDVVALARGDLTVDIELELDSGREGNDRRWFHWSPPARRLRQSRDR